VARRFEESTGVEIVEGYGLTEGSCLSSLNPPDGEKRIGSIGLRVPYQEMICVAVDPVGGTIRECKTDEVGRIAIRGPNVFAGYVEAAATAKMMLPGGWLDTGDLGRRDADGYFWLTGRSKDLIIRGDNIDPAVSSAGAHPCVALAAAAARCPCGRASPCAFVTCAERNARETSCASRGHVPGALPAGARRDLVRCRCDDRQDREGPLAAGERARLRCATKAGVRTRTSR
jgi:fatty-acyl-CoA synthase